MCLLDGVTLFSSAYDLYQKYKVGGDNLDIYYNFYDTAVTIQYSCNPLNTGVIVALMLYLHTGDIGSYIV